MEDTQNKALPRGQIAAGLLAEDDFTRLSALALLESESTRTSLSDDVVHNLLACLGHRTKKIQRGAATVLVRFAPQQPGIIAALTHKLTHPDARLRWTAAFTLSQLELPSPSPLPVLIENLGHQESDLRWAAATAVLQLARHSSQDVVQAMLQLVHTGNAVQRRMALYCLRDLKQTDHTAQDAYLASLHDQDPMVRLGGLSCVGKLRLRNGAMRAAMIRLLEHDPDMGVRRAAAVTCGQSGDTDSLLIGALQRASESDDKSLSRAATGALRQLLADL